MSAMIDKAQQLDELLQTAVQDDKESGVFRCRRDIFTHGESTEPRPGDPIVEFEPMAPDV